MCLEDLIRNITKRTEKWQKMDIHSEDMCASYINYIFVEDPSKHGLTITYKKGKKSKFFWSNSLIPLIESTNMGRSLQDVKDELINRGLCDECKMKKVMAENFVPNMCSKCEEEVENIIRNGLCRKMNFIGCFDTKNVLNYEHPEKEFNRNMIDYLENKLKKNGIKCVGRNNVGIRNLGLNYDGDVDVFLLIEKNGKKKIVLIENKFSIKSPKEAHVNKIKKINSDISKSLPEAGYDFDVHSLFFNPYKIDFDSSQNTDSCIFHFGNHPKEIKRERKYLLNLNNIDKQFNRLIDLISNFYN